MIARQLALFGLLFVSVSAARAQFLGDGDVSVYLKAGAGSSDASIAAMKSELGSLMGSVGVRLTWWDPNRTASVKDELIVLDLRGACEAPRSVPESLTPNDTPLASSATADGAILPFSAIDCSALSRFTGKAIAEMPGPQADYTYGRAMARLAAHEFYHVLSKKSAHTQTGIAKARFSSSDLLAGHLGFEHTVTAAVHDPMLVLSFAPSSRSETQALAIR